MKQCIHQLFMDYSRKVMIQLVLYNILIIWYHHETGKANENVSMKPVAESR